MKIPTLLVLSLIAALGVSKLEAANPTVVYLVRHAEKATQPPDDPALTTNGKKRAKLLASIMASFHPVAAFHTEARRTRDTAAPTVSQLNIPAILVPVGGNAATHAANVVAKIRTQFRGQTVLVVGHTNTLPVIIQRLGIASPPVISESQFNRMFKVTTKFSLLTPATLVETSYGN